MCISAASALSFFTPPRVPAAPTQPGRSGTYALKPLRVFSMIAKVTSCPPPHRYGSLRWLRLRPARHARPLPGMRHGRLRHRSGVKRRAINLVTGLSLLLFVAAAGLLRRRLLNFLMATSLLLCVAIVVGGARSYVRMDHLQWAGDKAAGERLKLVGWDWKLEWGMIDVGRDAATLTYASAEDVLRIERASTPHFVHRSQPATRAQPLGPTLWHRLGFFWYHQRSQSGPANPVHGFDRWDFRRRSTPRLRRHRFAPCAVSSSPTGSPR
jgi:hypothetical protein